MSAARRLAALQRYLSAIAPADVLPLRCGDPFHDRYDYRELARPLYSEGTERPPVARCPSCGGPRQSGAPFVVADADALRWHPERRSHLGAHHDP